MKLPNCKQFLQISFTLGPSSDIITAKLVELHFIIIYIINILKDDKSYILWIVGLFRKAISLKAKAYFKVAAPGQIGFEEVGQTYLYLDINSYICN